MGRDGQVQKKSFSATPPQLESLFERRPRRDPAQDLSVQLQADESPEWQARRERYIRNSPDFSKMPMEAPETVARQVAPSPDTAVQSARPALSLPSFARERVDVPIEKNLQRQTAPEDDESALQRQTVEEEPEADLQAKSLAPTVQRQESEEELEEIQPKLTIGQPGDRYEQEADAMAAKVMTMPEPGLQREELTEEEAVQPKLTVQREEMSEDEDIAQAQFVQREELPEDENPLQGKFLQREELSEEEETPVQRKPIAAVQAKADSSGLESQLQGSKGGGSPLAEDTRSFMESRFDTDFSHVRVHTDSSAVQMNKDLSAQAFTHGSDVYFGAGKSPGQNDLTAHELTHVVQQTGRLRTKYANPSNRISADKVQLKCPDCQTEDKLLQRKRQASNKPSEQPVSQIVQINQPKTPDSAIVNPKHSQEDRAIDTTPRAATQTDGIPKAPPKSSTETKATPTSSTERSPSAVENQNRGGSPSSGRSGSNAGGEANVTDRGSVPTVPAANPQLDTSSSEGLLRSVAATPASSFGQAVNQSKGAATQIQSQEKADLGANLPEIDRPTGLPSITERSKPVSPPLSSGQPPELKSAGGRAGAPPEVKHEESRSPVPGNQASTAVSAPPKDDSGGSWWNWLVNRVHNFLGSISAHDEGLSTSAGSRPSVDTSGEADPTQNAHNQQQSEQEVSTRKGAADQAVTAHFGENEIYPTVPAEKLRSTYKPSAPNGSKGSGGANPANLPEDMRANFDQHETPKLSAQANEQAARYRQQQAKYKQESQETRKQGQQRITQETEQTRTEQQGIQQQARGDVDTERQRWREENHKIQEKYANQSKGKQQDIDRQIHEKVQSTEKETDHKLSEAEQKAETERQNTERQAAEKKRDVENKPRSFWDGVKDSISSVFDSLRQTINGLFEGLRRLVKDIIEAAKVAVRTLIEAARSVIVGLIKGFGEFLKGVVSVALAAFPEAAAKARTWIDNRVDGAVNTVNKAADKLKQAADAILDWVGETLDKALSIAQGAFNLILDALEFLAKAPFEMMDLLAKLAETLKQYGSFINGLEELMNDPGALEAAAKETLQGYIDQIPAKAHEVIQGAMQQLGAPSTDSSKPPQIQRKEDDQGTGAKAAPSSLRGHLEGIWRHLEPGLQHIKTNWWGEIKKMVWDLVWPFNDKSPIWKDVPEMIHLPGKILSSLWNGQFSQAVDQYLQFEQKINSILGVFYGWFFIASVLVGTIIGAFFGGAGAIPGAAAGAAFAGEVGEVLLAAMVGTELSVIGKAVFDLAFGSGTEQVNESAYDRIASSGLTLGITGVFVVLSAIAGKIASELVSGVKGLFKGEVPEVPGVKVDAPEVKGDTPEVKPDAPETKGDTPEVKDLGTEGGKKVLAEEPTPDGHKVKVTEEGECLICSDCTQMKKEYAKELADPVNKELKAEFEAADGIDGKANPEAKAKAETEIRQKLEAVREKQASALDKFSRTPEELESLAKDPAHGSKIEPKTVHERTVALELEGQGELPGPVTRDPSGAAEFIDATGTKWDMKSFDSRFPLKKGGFSLERDLGKIEAEFNKGENVILDTTNLSSKDAEALSKAIEGRGWGDKIKWYPQKP